MSGGHNQINDGGQEEGQEHKEGREGFELGDVEILVIEGIKTNMDEVRMKSVHESMELMTCVCVKVHKNLDR